MAGRCAETIPRRNTNMDRILLLNYPSINFLADIRAVSVSSTPTKQTSFGFGLTVVEGQMETF